MTMSDTVLIADDDPVSRLQLIGILRSWGYAVRDTVDGEDAWKTWCEERPQLAVLDWVMPGMDGPTLCRKVRAQPELGSPYIILLTARSTKDDAVIGLDAGADDFLVKPFDRAELRARMRVGERILGLQARLAERVSELEDALARVKQLEGIIPICMYCKNVRNEKEYWQRVELYVSEHSAARFSHGICPTCLARLEASGEI
jgi:sigma-B regulation protein RsbU (phosphoserine phosphatase)